MSTPTYISSRLKKVLCSGLFCAGLSYDAYNTALVQRHDIQHTIRTTVEQYLAQQGFGPHNIPDKFRDEFQQKINAISTDLTTMFYHQNIAYVDVERTVRKNLDSFVNNLRTTIPASELEANVQAAVSSYIHYKGLSIDQIPSHAKTEYHNRISSIIKNLRTIMRNDFRDYVRTYEVEKAIKTELDVLIKRLTNTGPVTSVDWWSYFFGSNNNNQAQQQHHNVPAAQVARYDLEQKAMTIAYEVLKPLAINADNIPARVISDFGDAIQKVLSRMRDIMGRSGSNYVWKSDLEAAMRQELQPVIDKIQYKGELCTICQDDFRHAQRVGILSCGHIYHKECIYSWLERQQSCPLCREQGVIVAQQETVP